MVFAWLLRDAQARRCDGPVTSRDFYTGNVTGRLGTTLGRGARAARESPHQE